MKKVIIILFLISLFPLTTHAFDTSIKVYDYAQCLNTKEEFKLKESINKYINKYKIDIAIVTVKYHEKSDIKEYAMDFYNYNKFGINSTKDGIVFVLDFSLDKNIHIFPMGNVVNIYNKQIINKMMTEIDNNTSYYNKLNKLIKLCDRYINSNSSIEQFNEHISMDEILWIKIILISLIIPIMFTYFIFKNSKINIQNISYNYYDDKSLHILSRTDKFISTRTSSKRENKKN